MDSELTLRQQSIILKYHLGKTYPVSMPNIALYADFYGMMLDNPDEYESLAAITREAQRCLLYFGVDWRAQKSDNGMLAEIKELIKNLKVIGITGSEEELRDAVSSFDDTGGFVE